MVDKKSLFGESILLIVLFGAVPFYYDAASLMLESVNSSKYELIRSAWF